MKLCRSHRFLATCGAVTSCAEPSGELTEALAAGFSGEKAAASAAAIAPSASEEPRVCATADSGDVRRVLLCFPLERRRFLLCFRASGAPLLRPPPPGWPSRLARLDDEVRLDTEEELDERERERERERDARASDGRGDLSFPAFGAGLPAPSREW